MLKRLVIALLTIAGWVMPRPCLAQFIGYTSPQTVQQTLATNTLCTGSAQTFLLNNIGQLQHFLSVGLVVGAKQFQAELDGVDAQGNSYRISDIMELAGILTTRQGTLYASGYFPKIQAVITCSPNTATFSATYSGGWGTSNQTSGSYLTAQIDKINFFTLPANVNQQDNFQSPFGSSAGTLYFQYNTSSVANGSLTVSCNTSGVTSATFPLSVTLANTTALQTFQVPDQTCPFVQVMYTSPGGGITVTAEYVFSVPGRSTGASSLGYTHITGTLATNIKSTPGFLHTLSINTGAAGTISVFDLPGASCTGTPSTNAFAVITVTTATLESFIYDANLLNGICVKASAAMDFTVTSQ